MDQMTIVANFDTRREAEIAVERLVQEHGIERTDVFIRSTSDANTAGVRRAGADVESGHPGVEKRGEPELSGPIEISVDCRAERSKVVETALQQAGATRVWAD
ncbi:MAG: hypothetical protein ACOY4R_07025 [Pseudomonadota bacterium]